MKSIVLEIKRKFDKSINILRLSKLLCLFHGVLADAKIFAYAQMRTAQVFIDLSLYCFLILLR